MLLYYERFFVLLIVLLWSLWWGAVVQSFFLPAASRPSSSRRATSSSSTSVAFSTAPRDTTVTSTTDTEKKKKNNNNNSTAVPHLIFPGGGIYFYWQAGAVTYLREQGYDLDATAFTGASAGALTATLSATNVDFYHATEKALTLAADAGVWDRRGGLQGIWGPMIHDWLDDLLPDDAVERVSERLALLVTPVPRLGKERITHFRDKEDLISGCMASVHIPLFLNSKLTSTFRDRPYIDGSFLATAKDYRENNLWKPSKTLILDYNRDPMYQSQSWTAFIEAATPDGIYKMLEDGQRFASQLEEQGKFSFLQKKDT